MGSGCSSEAGPKSSPPPKQSGPVVVANGTSNNNIAEQKETNPSQEQARSPMEKQMDRYGYPPPVPPHQKKAEVFDAKDHKQLDKYASKVPDDVLYGTFEEIAGYLSKNCINDIQKVRAFFIWTTSIDIASLQSTLEKLPESGTPLDYLLKIHWQMGNHAHFFAQLCRAGGVPCIIVTGCNKSAAYQLGGKINKKAMAAQWNAVYADGQWRFVDVFWASTCVVGKKTGEWSIMDMDGEIMEQDDDDDEEEGETKHQVNEAFFLPDGDAFISTHFPDSPDWQLLEEPIDLDTFEKRVYIRERFFGMGLHLVPASVSECVVKPSKGEIDLEFGLQTVRDKRKLQFRYLIFKAKQSSENNQSQVPLERFVLFQKKSKGISYSCRFPATGRYKMDVFGQEDDEHETFDLCCSYLIDCDVAKKNCEPYPDMPDIGWGPGADADAVGLTAVSHEDPVIKTKDGIVDIKFKCKNAMDLMQNMKSNELDEWLLHKNACIEAFDDEINISMRLPVAGEYALNLFAEKEGFQGELPNVCNYLIKVEKDNPKLQAFPKLHDGIIGKSYLGDKLGIKAVSHPDGKIATVNGKFKVDFEHKDGVELFCEIENNNIDRRSIGDAVTINGEGTNTSLDVSLPTAGEYAMNVYAKIQEDDTRVYHVHTYMVTSIQKDKEETKASSGDVPVIPYATSGDTAVLQLPLRENQVIGELRKRNAQDPTQKDQIKSKKTAEEDLLMVKMPDEGEYRFDVFEKKPNGTMECICTYHLIRHEPLPEAAAQKAQADEKPTTPESNLTPEQIEQRKKDAENKAFYKAKREALKAAMQSQDPALIRQAIADFEKNNVPDEKGQVAKAKKLLRFLQLSNELTDAMSKRNLQRLEKAVEAAEKEGFEKKLGLQMKMARKVMEQLRRIEKLRHAILDLDQKTIAEIKSYAKPPDGVHQVMQATFLLLGNSEKEVKEWPGVVVLIGKTGKESLKRRITSDFNVESLKPETALKAKNKLGGFELDFIRDVSAGAGTFYVWVAGMIEECESRCLQRGEDFNTLRPKTGRPKTGKKSHKG